MIWCVFWFEFVQIQPNRSMTNETYWYSNSKIIWVESTCTAASNFHSTIRCVCQQKVMLQKHLLMESHIEHVAAVWMQLEWLFWPGVGPWFWGSGSAFERWESFNACLISLWMMCFSMFEQNFACFLVRMRFRQECKYSTVVIYDVFCFIFIDRLECCGSSLLLLRFEWDNLPTPNPSDVRWVFFRMAGLDRWD